jgi:alpha-D-ribose 1-methylphosphonate 5-triphosphate synthase subunit PhnH
MVTTYSLFEAQTNETFRALMWSLSYPGRAHALENASLEKIAQTLLDLEVSYYTPDDFLDFKLRATGAKRKTISEADYLFYTSLRDAEVLELRAAKRGNSLYPDESALVIVNASFKYGTLVSLSGPGIKGKQRLQADVPVSFWQARNEARHYPLGWDVLLCNEESIIGIPRSSQLEISMLETTVFETTSLELV